MGHGFVYDMGFIGGVRESPTLRPKNGRKGGATTGSDLAKG